MIVIDWDGVAKLVHLVTLSALLLSARHDEGIADVVYGVNVTSKYPVFGSGFYSMKYSIMFAGEDSVLGLATTGRVGRILKTLTVKSRVTAMQRNSCLCLSYSIRRSI